MEYINIKINKDMHLIFSHNIYFKVLAIFYLFCIIYHIIYFFGIANQKIIIFMKYLNELIFFIFFA